MIVRSREREICRSKSKCESKKDRSESWSKRNIKGTRAITRARRARARAGARARAY